MPIWIASLAGKIGIRGGIALLILGALLAVIAAQSIAINGLRFCPLKLFGSEACLVAVDGWKPRAEVAEMALSKVAKAAALAKAQARAQRLAAEKAFAEASERIDDNAELQLESSLSAAERFIAANRVRCEADRSGGGDPRTATGNHRAGNTEAAGAPTELDEGSRDRSAGLVAVPAEDVRICTENTIKAEAGHKWALEMERLSRTNGD